MTTSTMLKKIANYTFSSIQFVGRQLVKPATLSEETNSSMYWANVLNVKTMGIDESENIVSNKTQQIKSCSCIYWWM